MHSSSRAGTEATTGENPQARRATLDYCPSLTGARGFAAAWVLLFHLWQFQGQPYVGIGPLDLTPFFACGYFGVDLFFVLSGYLLALPFLRARLNTAPSPHLGTFWKNRCRRVLPAYLVQLALLAGIAAWRGKGLSPQDLLTHLTLTFNFFDNTSALNPVYWSMPVEWDFYILLPLLALGFARPSGLPWMLPAAILFSVSFRVLCMKALTAWGMDGLSYYRWIIQLPARIDEFAFGMTAAWLVLSGYGRPARRLAGPFGFLIALSLMILVAPLGDIFAHARTPWIYVQSPLLGISAASLILALVLNPSGLAARILSTRPALFLGTISYSLYLWHHPILEWLQSLRGAPLSGVAFALGAALACILAASLSYFLVESRFLKHQA